MVPHNLKLPVLQKQLPVDTAAVTMKQGGTSELPEPLAFWTISYSFTITERGGASVLHKVTSSWRGCGGGGTSCPAGKRQGTTVCPRITVTSCTVVHSGVDGKRVKHACRVLSSQQACDRRGRGLIRTLSCSEQSVTSTVQRLGLLLKYSMNQVFWSTD